MGVTSHVPNPKFDLRRLRRLYGTTPNFKSTLHDATLDTLRRVFAGEKDHKLSLEKLEAGYNAYESLANKIVALLDLLVDEYLLLNHTDPRKVELVRLMRVFMRGNKPSKKGEYKYGMLGMFDTSRGITIRLFLPENKDRTPTHDLVYNTVSDYTVRGDLNLKRAPLVEANWEPDLADIALALLRQATVLDELADV